MLDMHEYQREALTTLLDMEESPRELTTRLALGVSGEAGEIAEVVKKFARGDFGTIELRDRLEGELGDQLWYLAALAHVVGLRLEKVARLNLHKLHSRQERDLIRGDGDDR